jgi:aconitase B
MKGGPSMEVLLDLALGTDVAANEAAKCLNTILYMKQIQLV